MPKRGVKLFKSGDGKVSKGKKLLYEKLLKKVIETKHIKNVTVLPNFKKILLY